MDFLAEKLSIWPVTDLVMPRNKKCHSRDVQDMQHTPCGSGFQTAIRSLGLEANKRCCKNESPKNITLKVSFVAYLQLCLSSPNLLFGALVHKKCPNVLKRRDFEPLYQSVV